MLKALTATAFNLVLNDATTTIPSDAMKDSAIKSITANAVTTIGTGAFRGCSQLTTVSLPSATTLAPSAFRGCSQLTTVSLPSATTIGNMAFTECTSLTDVSLPAVTTIGTGAFYDCSQLTTVSLPSATAIGDYAFYGCASLTTLLLPDPVPNLGGPYAFTLVSSAFKIYTNDSAPWGKQHYPANSGTNYSAYTLDPLPSVTLSGATSVVKGSSITLTASPAGFEATPTPAESWTSDNSAIATVDASGVVTGVAAGTVKIRYTVVGKVEVLDENSAPFPTPVYIDNWPAQAVQLITVTNPTTPPDPGPSTVSVTGVTMSKTTFDLKTGESGQLSATVQPSNASNKKVAWTSSDPKVVSVDQTGKVTGVGPGTATITATTDDGKKTATCTVTVTEAPAPGPQEKALFIINVANCEIVVTQNEGGTLAVKVRIPFASGSNPTLLDTVKMIGGSLALSDISYVWVDAQGDETPVTRMAATAPYLEIRGTAANMDAIKDGAITSIQYTLKNDTTQYVQTFTGGGLKIANMSGYPSPEPTPSGSSSSGCDAGLLGGFGGLLALSLVPLLRRRDG